MSSYLPCAGSATSSAAVPETLLQAGPVPGLCPPRPGRDETGTAGLPAGMIAVRSSGAARPGAGKDGVLLAGAAAAPVIAGEMLVFCHPVTCAPAVVRRTGEVQAGGWLPDHVRPGVLEAQLGDGVIERLIAASGQAVPQRRQRIMSLELTARFVLAMTLMPDASYREVMARLAGLLPRVPWRRRWQVPSGKVITGWRRRLGDQVMEQLFWRAAGPVAGGRTLLPGGPQLPRALPDHRDPGPRGAPGHAGQAGH